MRMSERTNAQVWLKSRPNGIPQRSDFGIRMAAVPQLAEGQLLIRNEFLSVDPAVRGWICDAGGSPVRTQQLESAILSASSCRCSDHE